ncbi:alternative ribosome rescue aminoacyl-tRNA hydrolase ArfB [Sphingomonas sp. KR1UV-12]|uniref:Alternative ribosome rescue aminoacyl-tRNA hydrolase ArfB n=1 Tax=Sphingomonas aurea TaxID=3063994 RepID=A0ABT9EIJ4_9SPHN|nr:alternative ribosome rescue aminoacyl-tRNA hydrolase ArfB [Sphingomonas sp. KR1UV-12]MDP1026611.1 alternative ribosome rescue aminoacyl-tRNA hydrolase ArfB [Sphingomonas sp. KR1UV-12]
MTVTVPEDALEERFLAATGPGGQNVNKVATACQLRVDVYRLGLHPETFRRLKLLAGSRLTAGGTLVLNAKRYRTQEANRADARERLAELLTKASEREARRVKTKPSRAAKARRVDEKKGRSAVKAGRGRIKVD